VNCIERQSSNRSDQADWSDCSGKSVRLLLVFLALALWVLPSNAPAAVPLFVSPTGNDHWSGTLDSANQRQTDGPFRTLARALEAVRAQRQQLTNGAGQAATIFLRGGPYLLPEPVVLQPQDSNLTLAAYQNEQPILSGGRLISGWKATTVNGKSAWVAEVPAVRQGTWYFCELWINGQRATRARYPNHGYLAVTGLPDSTKEWTQGHRRFTFHPGDLQAWSTITNAEIVVMNRWVESRLPISSLDEAQSVVSFTKRSVFQLAPGDPYYLEGALEAMDQPGEWYLDRQAGRLYYLPRPGEKLESLEAVAPQLTQIVRLEGRTEKGEFVERVTLRGLKFAHTEWCFPDGFDRRESAVVLWPPPTPEVGGFGQAAVGVPGAVWGQGVRDCLWENCAFTHLGNYGLELARGCQRNRILHCDFSDLGAGGIKLGETALRSAPNEQICGNEISDCTLHDGGKMFASAVGIWLGQTPDNSITHNLIHDFYYTGISIGWTWGYGPALATNNLVAFNHVHHIGGKSDGDGPILSDMGGIYTLGRQTGARICNNVWHDIAGLRYGGWGIYFDEGSSGILAQSNLVYRTTHGGFNQHYGATNRVQNNIFALARDHQLGRGRPESHLSFVFETNIVYFDSGVLLGDNWSGDQYQINWNLYFDARPGASPNQMRFAGATLEQWRARGHDMGSVIADPKFVAPAQNDFRLQPDSPALKLGFQPLDLSKVGPRRGLGQ
jgi:hypothetical protein